MLVGASAAHGISDAGAVDEWAADDEAMQAASALAEMAESTWAGICSYASILQIYLITQKLLCKEHPLSLFSIMF